MWSKLLGQMVELQHEIDKNKNFGRTPVGMEDIYNLKGGNNSLEVQYKARRERQSKIERRIEEKH